MSRNYKLIVAIFVFLLSIFGCSSPTYRDAGDKIAEHVETTTDLLRPAHVVVSDDAFIDNKPVFHDYYPSWTERDVSIDLSGTTITLKSLMKELFKPTGKIRVIYDANLPDAEIPDLVFNGKLIDAIKEISKNVNYHFIIEKHDLIWTKKKTQIFQLGVLPGTVTYNMGGETPNSPTVGETVGDGAKGGDVSYKSSDGSSSWDTLKATLDKLISSEDGSYVINRDASIITVIDRPNNINSIADYIRKLNNYNMQQVGIKIQVIEVELNEEYRRGIDWKVIRTQLGKTGNKYTLSDSLNSIVAPLATLINSSNTDGISGTVTHAGGRYDASTAVIKFLEQQGNLTIMSEPRFTILNNQIAEIKITRDEGYVKQKTTTVSNLSTTQIAVTPGSIKTGFSLYVVPTIFDTEVLLQVTTSISRKLALQTQGSGDTQIQVPTISDRRFTQRSVVPNNHTLVLTGFKSVSSSVGDETPFKIDLLGGQGATKSTTEVVILITPVIIRG